MKRLFSAFCLLNSAFLFSDAPAQQPYDADLFWKDKRTVFVNIEGLAWTVSEGALDFAIKQKHTVGTGTANTFASGKFQNAEYDWTPGFRINAGWFNAPHYWDFHLQYTYFRCHGDDEVHHPDSSGRFLNGTWPQPDTNPASGVALQKASSHIRFRYDLLEMMFTRRYHPNPHLRIKLFSGPVVAWVGQDWKIHYRDATNSKSTLRNGWHFTGAGLRVGSSFDWYLDWNDLFVTGMASMKVLAGGYHNHTEQSSSLASGGEIGDAHFKDTRLTFVPQILAGPSWQKRFTSVRVEFFAGYELTIWTNLQDVYRSSGGTPQAAKETWINSSTVALQGVTARLTLDF